MQDLLVVNANIICKPRRNTATSAR